MVKDKEGDMLILVLPDLPFQLREPLVRQLQLTFGQRLTFTDSQKAGEGLQFDSFHFNHYNRYSAWVCFFTALYLNSKFLTIDPGQCMSFNSGSFYVP
jgi:hypothetical protein